MSATFYPAKQDAPKSFTYVGEEHVNLSNSNARYILEGLGYDPHFEEHNTEGNHIDILIEMIERYQKGKLFYQAYPEREDYASTVLSLMLASMKEGKQAGATHWYAA